MKFLKLLFSKIFVVLLLLLLQVGLIFTATFVLHIFPLFQLVSEIIALLIFLTIVNKKECPEFKIPWLVLLFIFPFFTIMVYILFANSRISKKDCERLQRIQAETKKYTRAAHGDIETVLQENVGIEKFLHKNAFLNGHLNNRVTYYKVGEDFWQALLEELEKAERYIFMEYFIVHRGKMWDSIHDVLPSFRAFIITETTEKSRL